MLSSEQQFMQVVREVSEAMTRLSAKECEIEYGYQWYWALKRSRLQVSCTLSGSQLRMSCEHNDALIAAMDFDIDILNLDTDLARFNYIVGMTLDAFKQTDRPSAGRVVKKYVELELRAEAARQS